MSAFSTIDLGASTPLPMMRPPAPKESRAHSPAPLIGSEDEDEAEASDAAPADRAGAPADGAAQLRLEKTRRPDIARGGSSAATPAPTVAPAVKPAFEKAAPKLAAGAPRRAVAPTAIVHYGVKSRDEIMGRAAGPVYNVKGGQVGGSEAAEQLATDISGRIADLQEKLALAGLSAKERAELERQLSEATKNVVPARQ